MAILPFGKERGWLSRLLYSGNPSGDLPFPTPVIDESQDWPLVPTTLERTPGGAIGVGTTPIEIYAPAKGFHGKVTFMSMQLAAGFPAADVFGLSWDRNPTAPPGIQLWQAGPFTQPMIPVIGSVFQQDQAGVVGFWGKGLNPIYVPSGFRLVLAIVSAAGGYIPIIRAQVYEREEYKPLPLFD